MRAEFIFVELMHVTFIFVELMRVFLLELIVRCVRESDQLTNVGWWCIVVVQTKFTLQVESLSFAPAIIVSMSQGTVVTDDGRRH